MILTVIILMVVLLSKDKKEEPKEELPTKVEKQEEPSVKEILKPVEEQVDASYIPNSMEKNKIIGQIVIDKINVKAYIFAESTKRTLDLGVAKFWGPDINEAGNFSISGHNFKKFFGNIKNLEIGDPIYIIDKSGRKVTYEVIEKVPKVEATDMVHIDQNTDGTKRITLITCNPSGVTRYIVKAKQKEEKVKVEGE